MTNHKTTVMLVCGGRDYHDKHVLFPALDKMAEECGGIELVVHGGARGADALADAWAAERGVACEAVLADWNRYGRAAGPMRNAAMLEMLKAFRDQGKDCIVVAFPGSRGTADMVDRACAADFEVVQVDHKCDCAEVH